MSSSSSRILACLLAWALLIACSASLSAASASTQAAVVVQGTTTPVEPATARVDPRIRSLTVLTPAPPYTKRDKAAQQPSMQELGLKVNMELAPLRELADRRGTDARLQALVGQMEHLGGDRAAAEERYQRAVHAAGKNPEKLRHVLWSRGWARLYSGDNEGALIDWRDAAKLHGGKPEWYPHTIALAYWRADQRALGMQWFEASTLAAHPGGSTQLPQLGLPMIAQSLIGDMFHVQRLRAEPGTTRLTAGSPELVWPAYIAMPPARYPSMAARSRRQGTVMSVACIDARGRVTATQVAESSGHADLDKAAIEAIVGWQFRPLVCGGKPRDSWVRIPTNFSVSEAGDPFQKSRARAQEEKSTHKRCESGVGLDPGGFTAVVAECYTHVTCSADAVWKPDDCPESAKTAAAAP